MLEKFVELLTRLVVAVEKIAANGGGGFVADAPKEKKEKAKKEPATSATGAAGSTTTPTSESAPAPKKNPFEDDETPAPKPTVTKAQVRAVLTDYANATSNEKGLEALAKYTSNAAAKMGDLLEADYGKVFEEVSKLLEATKK